MKIIRELIGGFVDGFVEESNILPKNVKKVNFEINCKELSLQLKLEVSWGDILTIKITSYKEDSFDC